MCQNGVSDQLLGRFTSLLLHLFTKKHHLLKMIQVGPVDGEIWRIGSEKWGSRRG